jgi:alpha-glucoside transport system substrate-binding protein
MLLAACSSSGKTSQSASPSAKPGCEPYAQYGTFNGDTVKLLTSILPPEQQKFLAAWKDFERCTGIKISYEGTNTFEQILTARIAAGNPPALAWIPQPGLIAKVATEANGAIPAPAAVKANAEKYWPKDWITYATVDGKFYGAPNGSNMKSLVWYSPTTFKDNGWTIPTTWAEMVTLSNTIASSGKMKPWCGGIGSGTATGWPSTDWLEEIVLRQYGTDVYDKWINHTIKFSSPEITGAMNTLQSWMKNPAWVNAGYGDVKTIATTTFQNAGAPILTGKCAMLQQASFYAAQWLSFKTPAGATPTIGETGDVNAFYLPVMSNKFGKPVEGAGEFTVAFDSKPATVAVQTYLSSAEFATAKAKLGGWVSANSGVNLDSYASPIDRLSAQVLADKTSTFRFDASDLMPAAVGAGSFWTQMTAWFAQNKATSQVLSNIDSTWPAP